VVLFGLFLAAIVYIISASLVRRNAPVFAPTPPGHARAANWQRAGDTLTVDASDGDRWVYVSLTKGRVLTAADRVPWEIAVQRYRVITPDGGGIADLGSRRFEDAGVPARLQLVSTTGDAQPENDAIKHWYRYNLLTHLLEPNGHVFVVRTAAGALWKLAVVSYYCPRLQAGCLTIRYAPVVAPE
jgi:hypothetical protein